MVSNTLFDPVEPLADVPVAPAPTVTVYVVAIFKE
jgi:hypothetical protein